MDFSQRDPPLTLKGFDQASHLAKTFPEPRSISVVLTSPLKRALQTTLKGFSQVLALNGVGEDGQNGAARLLVDRDLQETSDLPCDTGSDRDILEKLFPNVDVTTLDKDWFVKTGMYAADEEAVILRAKTFRKKLWNIAKSVQSDQSGREDGRDFARDSDDAASLNVADDDEMDSRSFGSYESGGADADGESDR
ncbi:histidine phosphatase superfamily (branch 1) domain-containing protein [Trichoderma breve]|uniref:Histidine phosphatase superfamily (Branch 1) domain-containing protein n=1 Tax=Trichoderma breve TaxID=2034170 RepID=A0A9W9EB41_9HYPO|nr:histidine phosphatase superfamily (branch 1) domain-containing protein [Trichoderma breve]KAJ4863454.1 histidine phosphatase superfamily (branch 1) domain-containing protein [Trichoderma breve]